MKLFLLFCIVTLTLSAQCNAVPGSVADRATVACAAPAAQADDLARILSRVIAARLNVDTVLGRLDELRGAPSSEPRTISQNALERMVRAMSPFKGQKISIGFVGSDVEVAQLADQIQSAVRRSGWIQPAPALPSGAVARGEAAGIDLTVAERTRATDALWNALLEAGLDVIAHINPAASRDGTIALFIYSRR